MVRKVRSQVHSSSSLNTFTPPAAHILLTHEPYGCVILEFVGETSLKNGPQTLQRR